MKKILSLLILAGLAGTVPVMAMVTKLVDPSELPPSFGGEGDWPKTRSPYSKSVRVRKGRRTRGGSKHRRWGTAKKDE